MKKYGIQTTFPVRKKENKHSIRVPSGKEEILKEKNSLKKKMITIPKVGIEP